MLFVTEGNDHTTIDHFTQDLVAHGDDSARGGDPQGGDLPRTAVAMVPEHQRWTLQEPHRSRIARGLAWAAAGSCVRLDLNSPEFQDVFFRLGPVKAPNGAKVYSFRLSQRVRAVAFRDDGFLRLISLHRDHDSAYEP